MRRCSVVTTGHLHRDHIAAIERVHGEVTVDRRCTDLVELIAVARAGRADAALVIGGTEVLTATRLAELHADGIVVVAVSDVLEERRRLADLGLVALPDEIDVELLIRALRGEQVEAPGGLDAELEALMAAEADGTPGAASAESPTGAPADSPAGSPDEAPAEPRSAAADDRGESGRGESGEFPPDESADPAAAPEDGEDGAVVGDDREESSSRSGATTGPPAGAGVAGDAEQADQAEESAAEEAAEPRLPGITVVWGAPGSPGRTTTAVNLAAELAGTGRQVLLVDADTVAASVAVQLGLIEESAGLAQACRQADLGRLDAARLRRIVSVVEVAGSRMHLLTGLPRADRWRELRERGLRQVVQLAREQYEHVVVDVSAPIEQDEDLTYDTFAPQRHAAAVAALEEADRVFAVGAADPVGFPRLVKALDERRVLMPEAPEPQVVINQLRAEVVGRSPEQQIAEAWAHWGASAPVVGHLPWDREACDVALLRGQVLAEAAPGSELRRAIAALAGVTLPERRRRLLRRVRGRRREDGARSRRRSERRGGSAAGSGAGSGAGSTGRSGGGTDSGSGADPTGPQAAEQPAQKPARKAAPKPVEGSAGGSVEETPRPAGRPRDRIEGDWFPEAESSAARIDAPDGPVDGVSSEDGSTGSSRDG